MLLSKSQQRRFWAEWKLSCQAQGWIAASKSEFGVHASACPPSATMNAAEIEQQRYLLLQRAGFESLTEVDPLEGFDRVLKELAILQNDLHQTLRADQMALTRLKFAIADFTETLGARYVLSITFDLFKTSDLDSLSEAQLTILHHTLANRSRKRRAAPRMESRLKPVRTARSEDDPAVPF